jgi:hypothetical protein
VDRRSFAGLRLGASVLRIFGVGDSYGRSDATIVRLDGSRELRGGRGHIEADVSYVGSADQNRQDACLVADLLTCLGTAAVSTLSLGTSVFYRVGGDWMVLGSAGVGYQSFTNYKLDGANQVAYDQPPNLLLTGFLRLSYRF